MLCRVVVATHPAGNKKSSGGVTRAGVVYELFFTNLPQQAFTASDVVELYLHRGAFEPALADEDQEIDPDRWCSHTACGQEAWCIVSQWVWNLRLELGHQVEPTPLRTTEFAPAQAEANEQRPVICGYGKPTVAAPWKAGRFGGARLCPPARRDVTLPSQSDPFGTRAAQGSRWESACGLRRQHSQLSSLSAARAVSMEWRRDREAPPGQRAAASAPGGSRTAALVRLEPQRTPARLSAAGATPTHRGGPAAARRRFARHRGRDLLPCAARAFAPLLGCAVGSQCASGNSRPRHDQAVRCSRRLCLLARFGNGVTRP